MKTTLILKYTYNNDYTIKTKARLVVCGYSQTKGVDYYDTYAPTTTIVVVFILQSIATMGRYEMSSFDVSATFLEDMHGFQLNCMLTKSLLKSKSLVIGMVRSKDLKYGLKSLTTYDTNEVYKMSSLYYYENKEDNMIMMITIHVDDGILVSYSCKANLSVTVRDILKFLGILRILIYHEYE